MTVELPEGYEPSPKEDYMNPQQLEYFRRQLMSWREELMTEAQETLDNLRDKSYQEVGDEADRASRESDHGLELRTRERERILINKIVKALHKLDDHEYGYCESCGVEIGIQRLEARPTADLCIDCKTKQEALERQQG